MKEITSAREGGVNGLRSRNAVSGRTDRAHGRATYQSMNGRRARSIDRIVTDLYDGYYYVGKEERGRETKVEFTPNGVTEFKVTIRHPDHLAPEVAEISGERNLTGFLKGIGFRNFKMKG